jgi:hypothetical protein
LISNLKKFFSNLPGWRTNRKILVIESDDWGSIRMPSRDAYVALKANGVDVDSGDSFRYNQYDTLANADDLNCLFETLQKHKDKNSRAAVFTAVAIVANPDFEKIKANNFERYFYEPFTETLKKYRHDDVFPLWQEGISSNLFVPQFHGREHLNVAVWMKALQEKDPTTMAAFEQRMWGFNNIHHYGVSYQAAFDVADPQEVEFQRTILAEGMTLFKELFGYNATFFVPPNGPFNNSLEPIAKASGVRFISGSKIQHESLGMGKTRKRFHYLGQQGKSGLMYLTRNCFFEPSQESKDWVSSCLGEIDAAFSFRKPAVISSHRVNYIGALDPSNRQRGIDALEKLLAAILQKWPEVEFMTSHELGMTIYNEKHGS